MGAQVDYRVSAILTRCRPGCLPSRSCGVVETVTGRVLPAARLQGPRRRWVFSPLQPTAEFSHPHAGAGEHGDSLAHGVGGGAGPRRTPISPQRPPAHGPARVCKSHVHHRAASHDQACGTPPGPSAPPHRPELPFAAGQWARTAPSI